VPGIFHRADDQRGDLVAGERDPVIGWRAGVLGDGRDGEEGQGEHGQGGPPVRLGLQYRNLFVQGEVHRAARLRQRLARQGDKRATNAGAQAITGASTVTPPLGDSNSVRDKSPLLINYVGVTIH